MTRGSLRIYLGSAPGVGKTYAMLGEGRRRKQRGTDVVIGIVDARGRLHTEEQVGDLERIATKGANLATGVVGDLDAAAVIDRAPGVVLVDDLAEPNTTGGRRRSRWQDIDEILDAGIDVVATLDIEHLASLEDVVQAILGRRPRGTVPDVWVRAADQVELVDMSPEALRRRLAHGNVYPAAQVDAALADEFRVGSLAALRELALLWTADRVDDALREYRTLHGIEQQWETRERVAVAITGAPGNDLLIRRAARIAQRARADLLGIHVCRGGEAEDDGPDAVSTLAADRRLLLELGGRYVEVAGDDIPAALVETARAENATQLVLGASGRSRFSELLSGSVVDRTIRASGPIDVHVIKPAAPAGGGHAALQRRSPRRLRPPLLSMRRRAIGWVLALLGPPGLTAALSALESEVDLATVFMVLLLLVVGTAAVGGTGPALLVAVSCSVLANWYFVPPLHTWSIDDPDNAVALVVFTAVATIVSWLVASTARRSAESSRARAQAETLARLAAAGATPDPLVAVVEHLRDTFELDAVAVLVRQGDRWDVEAGAGTDPPVSPEDAHAVVPVADGIVLAVRGANIAADDRHVLHAFASQLGAAVQRRRLSAEAATATELAQVNHLRNALLAAVSHDLRTPLASIKVAASSLLADDVVWSQSEVKAFAAAIDGESDRLAALVANLLDMSRLTAGAVTTKQAPIGIDEVVLAAIAGLGDRGRHGRVEVAVPEVIPPLDTDATLLERVVANLVDNALTWSPDDQPVRVEAALVGSALHLRVIDHGPGIPVGQRDEVFEPFHRLGTSPEGVGLGLAVARGFVDALGGALEAGDTPGGGTTMLVTLPTRAPGERPDPREETDG